MTRRATTLAITAALCLSLVSGVSVAKGPPQFTPGSAGLDDPYYPLDGNGGYDVEHYLLDVSYDPSSDVLMGITTITAKATQNLSAFNLDLDGLIVRSATVNGQAASYVHEAGELTITPASPIRANTKMMIVIVYEGVPETLVDLFGVSGFIHTDDGALVIGQPHVAATWFPANDHPTDRAAFTFLVTVPDGLEVVANGTLGGQSSQAGWTTWQWDAPDPMSTYLAGMAIGELAIRSYTVDKIDYVDALDPDLLPRVTGHTGAGFVLSQQADDSYKRITRSIDVPAEGPATLSFWVNRDTEPGWDFFFVEAHTVGADDWTTLPDENGNTTQATGGPCPFPNLELLHPFLMHYQTANPPEAESPCSPTGSAGTPPGEWWAASGSSGGWEQWIVDLSPFAGTTAEVSLTYVSDDIVQLPGVFIDDIEISTADGSSSTSFEAGDTGGWQVPGVPPDGTENTTDWFIGTSADAPASVGEIAHGSLDRQSEIISFLEESFGPYPYDVGGGIVDDADIGFALENQTRPIYSKLFFSDSFSGDAVIVHELAHQWFGDNLTIEEWQHIWLNEGFATYAEWLWSEREGLGTAQEVFDFWYGLIPPDDPFWSVTIGDPGVNLLFDFSVYIRGGMTLHQLRLAVGEDAFFSILERWAKSQSGDTVTTNEFIALAEKVSGQQLDELFQTWLFTAGQPVVEASALRSAAPAAPIWLRASRELDGGPRK